MEKEKAKQWKILTSESEYKEALERTIEIFHAEDGTPDAKELDLLLGLVKDYEDKHISIPQSDV